jgi:Tfp pilus assembly PilM family ATPase
MNGFDFMNSSRLYIEIGQSSMRVLNGEAGLELPLQHLPNGRLTGPCKERLTVSLQTFLKRQSWQPRVRALCAIGARGVSLRRLTLPSVGKDELQQLLRLQIESEFPLPPDELAWGYRQLGEKEQPNNEAARRQELLVMAVKKEVLEEYSEVLTGGGVSPVFTLAALARSCICAQPPGTYAVLDIGPDQSELMTFDNGVPIAVRILPWGDESINREEAEKQKINLDQDPGSTRDPGLIQTETGAAVDLLTTSIKSNWTGQKLYLTGRGAGHKDVAARLAKNLGGDVECDCIDVMPGEGRSAAILGLKKFGELDGDCPLLIFQVKEAKGAAGLAQPEIRKWAVRAVLFLLGCALFPYAEAFLLKSHLSKKISQAKASRWRLATIDHELSFLQYLKKNQPPYLDAMFLMATAAPSGTRLDSLSMNRRGEVSLRGSLKDSQQVVQFRSKLIDSGFFSSVVVEEQTPAPTPDRQKVLVRMTAQWKPVGAREALKIGPSAEEMEKIKVAAKEIKFAAPQMMPTPFPMMPPGMPPPARGMAIPAQSNAPGPPRMPGLPGQGLVLPQGAPIVIPPAEERKE